MKARLLVALAVLIGLPAFAPAPLPRTPRRGDANEISLSHFQGSWRTVSFDSIGADNRRIDVRWFQTVRVENEKWTYVVEGQNARQSSYRIAIEGTKRPAALDFFQGNAQDACMSGIIRREGNRVTILYYSAGHQRPTSFENPPVNWWLLVLERQ